MKKRGMINCSAYYKIANFIHSVTRFLGFDHLTKSIYIYKNGCVCVCVCVCMFEHNSGTPGAISTKLGTHIVICMCMNLMYIYIPQGGWCGRQGIWMIHIVGEIKLLLLLGNRLKHIRGYVSYLVTWNIREFTVGYFLRLDNFFSFIHTFMSLERHIEHE
jgi:hypothetical protein